MEGVSPVGSPNGSMQDLTAMYETEQIEVHRLDVTEVHAQLEGLRPSSTTASPEARLSAIWRRFRMSRRAAYSKLSPPTSSRVTGCFSRLSPTATWSTVQVILELPPNQPHHGEIAKLLVHRSARKRGIAQLLMEHAEAEARAEGKSLLVLDTVTGDAAERLYADSGGRGSA